MQDTSPRTRLICTCEGTLPLQPRALGVADTPASQLCRAQLDNFRAALGEFASITVACTQEALLFTEVAANAGYAGTLQFANIRETAGWSDDGAKAAPKMAALLGMAEMAPTAFDIVTLESGGVTLILGRDDVALTAARDLSDLLDITVLLLPGADVTPPRQTTWPVLQGRIGAARGHLGAFALTVNAYAAPAPSSRTRLDFGKGRDGAVSQCDLVLDLTGNPPLFPHARPGYLRADPRDPAAVARLVAEAGQMTGTFDEPKYIDFTPSLCAHSRNQITGCTRCLDLCPAGAIAPDGDVVSIDPAICAGCGQCAAACPTGAAAYAMPVVANIAARLRRGLSDWFAAGARTAPVILLHDEGHGADLIDALARHGRGLPAHVIPMPVNAPSQIGPEVMAAALAWGAGGIAVLAPARPVHPLDGLAETMNLMATICDAMGFARDTCALIQTDDPDALDAAVWHPAPAMRPARSSFLPPDDKRGLLTLAVSELNRTAPRPADRMPLAAGAPFGAVVLDADACTLCLACVGACPAGALGDNPDRPMLRFTESACVQCGICAATCPEEAITLAPQIDLAAWTRPRQILKEEEPFCCASCGKAFGTASSIRRVLDKLDGHWMFSGPDGADRRRLLEMCDDCRTRAVVIAGFDPHAAPR
ncbi:4Fe-4S dicluster domain-containing protein [Loktanella fryxellensis]|uniref:4Fe-4S dicluster domain-containing protein n=1 Tax=Loktanella fryxellensis TaxID=245187 RepID=A0A1H8B617_9RHOB|nr:4Fe-4S dicluster domain-containing protein [Loktanella fryxellensis]SEM78193.1 4Fe-4S dicluster domain-containing protein [Loktanella fryxellensis]